MKFGIIPTEGGRYFKEALEEAVYSEEMGFDSVWLEEHHSIRNHYWPSPLIALAGIATRTSRILLGTDIAVLPLYHPVRAAEDIAVLDVITGGRTILGVAIGYREPEFSLYGIPMDRRGARYVEVLKISPRPVDGRTCRVYRRILSDQRLHRTAARKKPAHLARRLGRAFLKAGCPAGRCLGSRTDGQP